MDEFVPVLGQWTWLVVAGVLLFLELMAPGVFFIWLAMAAAVVGGLDLWLDLAWQAEFLLFAALAVLSVFCGRMLMKSRQGHDSDAPHLNQRMRGYVGQVLVLHEPIKEGQGKITIDDTIWDVLGPDAPEGTRVKVSGVEGLRLTVEIV